MKKIFDKLYTFAETYFTNEYSADVGMESFDSAMKCYDNKEYEKALELYKIALKYEPNSDATYFNIGNVYFVQKDYDQALIHYNQASLLNEHSPNVNAQIAKVYFEQKKYDKALKYYLESEKRDELNENLYIEMGYCYSVLKEYRKSIEMYQKAIQINPKIDYIYESIALNYQLLEEFPESIHFYKKALAYEYNEETVKNLAHTYYLNAQYKESKVLVSSLLNKNPNDNDALYMKGTLLLEEKNYSESLNYLLKSIEEEKPKADVVYNISIAYLSLGEFEKSIEFGLKLLELETNNPCHYCNLFEAQLMLNRPFTENLEEEFIKKFKDDKESFILYSHLKILEDIILEKEVDLEEWEAIYDGVKFREWEFNILEHWINGYENEDIEINLLEALACFKRKL